MNKKALMGMAYPPRLKKYEPISNNVRTAAEAGNCPPSRKKQ